MIAQVLTTLVSRNLSYNFKSAHVDFSVSLLACQRRDFPDPLFFGNYRPPFRLERRLLPLPGSSVCQGDHAMHAGPDPEALFHDAKRAHVRKVVCRALICSAKNGLTF